MLELKRQIKEKVQRDFKEALKRVEQNLNYFRKIENERNTFNPEDWIKSLPSLDQIKNKLLLMKEYRKESNERIKDYFQGILHVNAQLTREAMLSFIDQCH